MGDVQDILNWEPDPSPDHPKVEYREGGSKRGIIVILFTHIA
jgi:hypothetical protein